jgi:UDP-2,3-diacylglucosamine pyrophosphatase LpxH
MPQAPFLEESYHDAMQSSEGSTQRSALHLSWNHAGRTRTELDPGRALFLLRRQLHLLESTILSLPCGSKVVADWEAETERLLKEILSQASAGMHPSLYRFKYPFANAELSCRAHDGELQSHYRALQRTRRQLLKEVLGQMELNGYREPGLTGGGNPASRMSSTGVEEEPCLAAVPKAVTIPVSLPPQEKRPATTQVDTFLFSDLHLGSDVSRCKELLQVLQSYRFKRLILLGDIFDDLNFKRLRRDHWEMLSWLRKLSDPDKSVEIIWILGNHDLLLDSVSRFVGIEVRDKYMWEHQGKRFLAIHGHQFDRFLEENVVISQIATTLYILVQKLDTRRQRCSRLLKRLSKKWLRLSHQVALRAARYARMQGADYVFCGHTHRAAALELEGVGYFNTGCWTDLPSHFVTIDSENRIELHERE